MWELIWRTYHKCTQSRKQDHKIIRTVMIWHNFGRFNNCWIVAKVKSTHLRCLVRTVRQNNRKDYEWVGGDINQFKDFGGLLLLCQDPVYQAHQQKTTALNLYSLPCLVLGGSSLRGTKWQVNQFIDRAGSGWKGKSCEMNECREVYPYLVLLLVRLLLFSISVGKWLTK